MAKLACFILLVLLLSSLETDGADEVVEPNKAFCIPRGHKCLRSGKRRCCGGASCQPKYVCVRAPCPAPYVCK